MDTDSTLVQIFYRVGVIAFPLAAMLSVTIGLASIRSADTLVGSLEGLFLVFVGLVNALFALQSLHVCQRIDR